MDDTSIAAFEARAAAAEQRLLALERKQAQKAGESASAASPALVEELEQIRATVARAKAEQNALQQKAAQLETENTKLRYRVEHMKTGMKQGDQQLKTALFGDAQTVEALREQFSYLKEISLA
ncbi:hypothetical protein WJX72_010707 [[Myrmecia] bisecta]|uniref:Uncharacterized protein n=1 Tax=[Myrmecia] bisecta TaxID=41462 RepID=A0AAW1P9C3_9CHLO